MMKSPIISLFFNKKVLGACLFVLLLCPLFLCPSEKIETSLYKRNPASVKVSPLKKMGHLSPLMRGFLHQKVVAPIHIRLESLNNQEIVPGVPFDLQLSVLSSSDCDQVQIHWNLPPFVKLVGNSEFEELPDVGPENKFVKVYQFISNSEENQQIHVNVKANFEGKVLADVTQYNTLFENDIKQSKDRLAKRNKDYMQGL